ncbi:Protein kinase like protein [Zostera marina]|uniref:non-specific serine/threonine protein kinase n=1 Tax=Zostera marina TaxID=29655 RepID=A0A0K9PVW5_ZOSMR|nr:Protein kinase like protein [Zostera marina]
MADGIDEKQMMLDFKDLRFIRRIGSGDVGRVYIVETDYAFLSLPVPATGSSEKGLFAAKVMSKKDLENKKKEGRAKAEKEILEMLDHPFLPKLLGFIENERLLCLLMEFCSGGDLHTVHRRRYPVFKEDEVRFYVSEVVAAMEYLHMLGIIYRDLKPENVLVRSDGHIMLTDFDLSLKCNDPTLTSAHIITGGGVKLKYSRKSCIHPVMQCFRFKKMNKNKEKERKSGKEQSLEFVAEPEVRSKSFVGTHEYLAPEMISGESHGSEIDWWALGVFMYELFYEITPFRGCNYDVILENIVENAIEFPKVPTVSPMGKDLMRRLLVKNPKERLGFETGATAVKKHPFFNGVNWALLRCNTPPYIPPPYVPKQSKSLNHGGSSINNTNLVDYY